MKKETGLLHATDELRELILEHPELPLLVFAGQESNNGEWGYMACGIARAEIGEFLDCEQTVNDERCFTDRDDFQEEMENNSDFDGTDEEFAEYIKGKMAEYEPYWKPCISSMWTTERSGAEWMNRGFTGQPWPPGVRTRKR